MFRQSRPTQVPWKCDHCGAKYMVTLAAIYDGSHETVPCKACGQKMHWKSDRKAVAVEPLFESTETT